MPPSVQHEPARGPRPAPPALPLPPIHPHNAVAQRLGGPAPHPPLQLLRHTTHRGLDVHRRVHRVVLRGGSARRSRASSRTLPSPPRSSRRSQVYPGPRAAAAPPARKRGRAPPAASRPHPRLFWRAARDASPSGSWRPAPRRPLAQAAARSVDGWPRTGARSPSPSTYACERGPGAAHQTPQPPAEAAPPGGVQTWTCPYPAVLPAPPTPAAPPDSGGAPPRPEDGPRP